MNKRHLHHTWTRLRRIKPWYFLILAIISGLICIFALRGNNQHMIELRDNVYAADKENGDTETALRELQAYVTTHMNTNLSAGKNAVYPPIQLKYTYDRLVQAQSGQTADSNQKIYTDAQHSCEQQNSTDISGRNRVPCIQAYVQAHTVVPQTSSIPDALYKFSFVSPVWSPGLAGWSMLVAIISLVLFVISFIANRWFKHALA
jgi:hypothetical protein